MLHPGLATRAVRQVTRSGQTSPGQTPSRAPSPPAGRPEPRPVPSPSARAARDATLAAANDNHLSHRELQVLIGMSRGMSNPEIGATLYICEDTVKTHVRRLLRKIGARNRAHAVHRGWELGILSGWEIGILPSGGAR